MRRLSQRIQIFTTLPFIIALALLLLNDFYFKSSFANSWTGKLSDVAGLFLFPIFWISLVFLFLLNQIFFLDELNIN